VSTTDQSVDVQRAALVAAGVPEPLIFCERVSGTSTAGRDELARVLTLLREGDSLAVTRLDRLGRSLRDLANIAHELSERGAHLIVTEQAVDTSTSAGRAFFGMLAVFAAFETDIRRERQAEGIAKAKKAGAYKGRPATVDVQRIRQLRAEGMRPAEIRRHIGCSESAVFRALRDN
jgi:DNA invertase Pin-like site-specific DNA recombinase